MKDADARKLKELESQVGALLDRVAELEKRIEAIESASPVPRRYSLPRTVLKNGEFSLPQPSEKPSSRPARRREPPKC